MCNRGRRREEQRKEEKKSAKSGRERSGDVARTSREVEVAVDGSTERAALTVSYETMRENGQKDHSSACVVAIFTTVSLDTPLGRCHYNG